MNAIEEITAAGKAALWTRAPLVVSLPITEAWVFRTVALPGVRIDVYAWADAVGFRARLLVCGIERAVFDRASDILNLFADPTPIGPRCRIGTCDRPSRHEGDLCPFHERGFDPDSDARLHAGDRRPW